MKNFKELRKALSITRKELADELEIAYRTLENWEQGTNKPSEFTKTKLYETLFEKLEKKVCGKKWGEIDEKIKNWLQSEIHCCDGITGNETENGECIIDLRALGENFCSISGKIITTDDDVDVIIEDNAIIYKAY